ncbi:hypothetical protein Q5752_002933 [Cryptotrichosporon argae]
MSDAGAATEKAAKALLGADPGLSFGPYIMCLFFDATMLGIMLVQFASWWSYGENDRVFVKVIVYASALLGLTMSIYSAVMEMHLFAFGFGVYAPFESVDWLGWWPLLDGIVATFVQAFYVDRAYRLNGKNPVILVFVVPLMVASFGAALGTKIKFSLLTSESQAAAIDIFVEVWLGCSMAIDVAITSLVGWGLYKSKTGWSETDRLVKRLILLSVETQLPPTLFLLGFLIEYIINPSSMMGVFFEVVISKVYILGFFAVLNSRYRLRRDFEGAHSSEPGERKTNTFGLGSARPQQATVQIRTETYTESFQLPPTTYGLNRAPPARRAGADADADADLGDLVEGADSEAGSIDKEVGLEINHSRTGLNRVRYDMV